MEIASWSERRVAEQAARSIVGMEPAHLDVAIADHRLIHVAVSSQPEHAIAVEIEGFRRSGLL